MEFSQILTNSHIDLFFYIFWLKLKPLSQIYWFPSSILKMNSYFLIYFSTLVFSGGVLCLLLIATSKWITIQSLSFDP